MPKPSATPPFRADHVGSLLAPTVAEAAPRAKAGTRRTKSCETWKTAPSRARSPRQEALGLRSATDGEYRRAYWHFDFVAGLRWRGSLRARNRKFLFKGGVPLRHMPCASNGRSPGRKPVIDRRLPIPASHVLGSTRKASCRSRPSRHPGWCISAAGDRRSTTTVYPTLDGFFADLGEAYHKAVAAFGAAGCRYLQLDEVNIAYLCDPEQIASAESPRRARRTTCSISTPAC